MNDYVTIIDPIKDDRWDKFVENHPFGWIYHLSDWKHILEKSYKHIKGHYLVLFNNESNTIKAALPLFEIRSWLTGNRLVSAPFATLFDPLVSTTSEMKELFESVLSLSKKLQAKYIEIRTLASSSFIQDDRLGDSHFYKHHYLLLENGVEQLKKNFHRSCVRQRIARSLSNNLSLKVIDNESDLQTFYRLYLMTRKRLRLPPQPYIFFKSLWDTFSPAKRITVFLAEYKELPIAGLILLKFKDRVSAEFAASNESYRDLSPNHFLFWEAIKLACHEKYKIFDFGRTSSLNKPLMEFKSRWGTQVIDLIHYYYPKQICEKFDKKEKSAGYRLITKICKIAPDYAFQNIGRFCYRHLG